VSRSACSSSASARSRTSAAYERTESGRSGGGSAVVGSRRSARATSACASASGVSPSRFRSSQSSSNETMFARFGVPACPLEALAKELGGVHEETLPHVAAVASARTGYLRRR